MKRLLVLGGCLAALLAPAAAQAHPLGNFTINRHTAIELSGGRIYVQYALDLAEIPTLQEGKRVRSDAFAAEVGRRLELRVDGRRAPLRVLEHRTLQRPGAGGLKTLRFDAVYERAADRVASGVPRPQLRVADRLEGSGRALERRRRIAHRQRSRHEPEQRPPRLPAGSAPLPARRHDRDGRFVLGDGAGTPRRSTASRPPTIVAAASSR